MNEVILQELKDKLIVAEYRIKEAINILDRNTVRGKIPWYKRWRYKTWTLGGAAAHHALSKGIYALNPDLFFGEKSISHEDMKVAETRIYLARKGETK